MIVHRCNVCRTEAGRPLLVRNNCASCATDFMVRHTAQFPHHILESSAIDPDWIAPPSRSTQRLLKRAAGW